MLGDLEDPYADVDVVMSEDHGSHDGGHGVEHPGDEILHDEDADEYPLGEIDIDFGDGEDQEEDDDRDPFYDASETHEEEDPFYDTGEASEYEDDDREPFFDPPGEAPEDGDDARDPFSDTGEDPGDDDPGDAEEIDEVDDYFTLLKYLSKEWVTVELDHRVSKVASEAFWDLGKRWFHRLFNTKKIQRISRKTPSFTHLRKQLYKDYVPPIRMDIAYMDKETGELTIVEDTPTTPKKQFPSNRFKKMWEIAHVKVTFVVYMPLCTSNLLLPKQSTLRVKRRKQNSRFCGFF